MLDGYIKWVEAHERHLVILAAGILLWVGIGKFDQLLMHHDQAGLQQAQIVAAQQAQKNAEVLAVVQQQAVDLKALNDRVLSQQAALEQANVNLANALIQQKKTDATLPPNELAARWNTLVPAALAGVTPNGVILPLPGAVATVQSLEEVPVLTKQLDDVKQELVGERQIAAQQEASIASLNVLVAGKDPLLKDADRVNQEQIKVVKDAARKSKRKWAIVGAVAGFIVRTAVKMATGI